MNHQPLRAEFKRMQLARWKAYAAPRALLSEEPSASRRDGDYNISRTRRLIGLRQPREAPPREKEALRRTRLEGRGRRVKTY